MTRAAILVLALLLGGTAHAEDPEARMLRATPTVGANDGGVEG